MQPSPKGQAVRPPVVAGAFYPETPSRLNRLVDDFLSRALGSAPAAPKAVIAPHAGYDYSGPIAGSAFRPWQSRRSQIKRVVLIGPSHRVAFDGLALTRHDAWQSPLGLVPVDLEAVEMLARLPAAKFFEEAHAYEHCLEVELAFLQKVLDSFSIVPIVTGDVAPEVVADALALLWGGDETVYVISSDLSHYLDYASAQKLDRHTADAIEELAPAKIRHHQACGRTAIQGFLQVAEQKKLEAATLDLRNSGDTAGGYDRVVGYGAFSFTAASTPPKAA